MILPTTVLLIAALLPLTWAYPVVTGPTAGEAISGLSLDITWKDNDASPTLSQLANYQIFLCAGGNDADNFVRPAAAGPGDQF